MKKSAFTIIEFIFVIVIMAVLVVIAITKFKSIKDNAKTVVITTHIRDGIKEIVNYYTSKYVKVNFNDINFSSHSTQIFSDNLVKKGWAKIKDSNHIVIYSNRENKNVCISCITDGAQIEVETNVSNNDSLCQNIKKVMPVDRNYSILNNRVNF